MNTRRSWTLLAAGLILAGCIDTEGLVFDGGVGTQGNGGTGAGGGATGGEGGTGVPGYAGLVMAEGPLGYWRLNEPEGTSIAADSSGNGHDALYFTNGTGTITRGQPGALEGDPDLSAIVGDGAQIILDPHPFLFEGTTPYSAEAWVQVVGETEEVPPNWILSCPAGFGAGTGYETFIWPDSIYFERHDDPELDKLSGTTLFTTTFRHIVATFDGSVGWLYIDALPTEPNASTFDVSIPAHVSSFFVVNTQAAGVIAVDELAIYDHALSLEVVEAHFRCGSTGECD